MKCTVLNKDSMDRFLNNELSPEESEIIIEHLKSDCPVCERFVEQMDEEDLSRMLVVFNEAAEAAKKQGEQTDAKDIGKSGSISTTAAPAYSDAHASYQTQGFFSWLFAPFKASMAPVWVGGLVVVVVLSALILPQNQESLDPVQFEKGKVSDISSINLKFATGHRDEDGKMVFNKGVIGDAYPESEFLFLHYELPRDGHVYFVSYQANGNGELIYPDPQSADTRVSAGKHTVTVSGKVDGIPLTGRQGRNYIVGIYSPMPLSMDGQIMPIVRKIVDTSAGTSNQQAVVESIAEDVAVDMIYFDVHT